MEAPNLDYVYAELRARGIRPVKVHERMSPVVRLGLRGLRKRDCFLLVSLALLMVGVALVLALRPWRTGKANALPRHSIAITSSCDLSSVFANVGDAYLAQYAIPGMTNLLGQVKWSKEVVDDLVAHMDDPVVIAKNDDPGVVELMGVVIGMKADAASYLRLPDGAERLRAFLDERQQMESIRFSDTLRRVMRGELTFDKANEILRGMGLQGSVK